jgi:hypothetical protein
MSLGAIVIYDISRFRWLLFVVGWKHRRLLLAATTIMIIITLPAHIIL